jgi:hypothetical protein
MHSEQPQSDVEVTGAGDAPTGRPRLSRRQAMGRMSAVATAGAVAWVVPEILTAKPAAGAALSNAAGGGGGGSVGVSTSASSGGNPGTGASVGASGTVGTNGPDGVTTDADTTAATGPSSLAFTGLNIQRDAEVGAAMVAGGWAMQHWASRTPKPAAAGTSGPAPAEGAGGA